MRMSIQSFIFISFFSLGVVQDALSDQCLQQYQGQSFGLAFIGPNRQITCKYTAAHIVDNTIQFSGALGLSYTPTSAPVQAVNNAGNHWSSFYPGSGAYVCENNGSLFGIPSACQFTIVS